MNVNRMWLDGIYMADVYYARWTHQFEPGNTTAWDDVALQVSSPFVDPITLSLMNKN